MSCLPLLVHLLITAACAEEPAGAPPPPCDLALAAVPEGELKPAAEPKTCVVIWTAPALPVLERRTTVSEALSRAGFSEDISSLADGPEGGIAAFARGSQRCVLEHAFGDPAEAIPRSLTLSCSG